MTRVCRSVENDYIFAVFFSLIKHTKKLLFFKTILILSRKDKMAGTLGARENTGHFMFHVNIRMTSTRQALQCYLNYIRLLEYVESYACSEIPGHAN